MLACSNNVKIDTAVKYINNYSCYAKQPVICFVTHSLKLLRMFRKCSSL